MYLPVSKMGQDNQEIACFPKGSGIGWDAQRCIGAILTCFAVPIVIPRPQGCLESMRFGYRQTLMVLLPNQTKAIAYSKPLRRMWVCGWVGRIWRIGGRDGNGNRGRDGFGLASVPLSEMVGSA